MYSVLVVQSIALHVPQRSTTPLIYSRPITAHDRSPEAQISFSIFSEVDPATRSRLST